MDHPLRSVAAVIAILALLPKMWELLLRPHQQDRVQKACDHLTLVLSDMHPREWFRTFARSRVQVTVVAGVGFLSLVLFTLCFWGVYVSSPFPWTSGVFWFSMLFGPGAFYMVQLGPKVTAWMCSDGRFPSFLKRFILFAVMMALLVGGILGILFLLMFAAAKLQFLMLGLLIGLCLFLLAAPLVGVLGFWWIMTLTGLVVIFAEATLLALEALTRLCEAVLWRITENSKGAWAAIGMIVAIVVAVAEFYVKK